MKMTLLKLCRYTTKPSTITLEPKKESKMKEDEMDGFVEDTSREKGSKLVKGVFYSIILVVPLTSCWYFASSKNAIATQQLVQTYEVIGDDNYVSVPVMAILTSLQIIMGLFISLPLYLISKAKVDCRDDFRESWARLSGSVEGKTLCIVGSLHFIGCFFTNMGFSYGSATLVQVIKLLEPVETLIFMAFANVCIFQKKHGITAPKATGTFLVVTGALLLLLQKGVNARMNPASVGFAFLSGFCMATRNVVQKSGCSTPTIRTDTQWLETLSNGLRTFFEINVIAGIPSLTVLLLTPQSDEIRYAIWNTVGGYGVQAISFHTLYNMASISVLSITTAQTHSLLNVGKRITNVISATIFFGVHLEQSGYFGLLVALFGGLVYSGAFNKIAPVQYDSHDIVPQSKFSKRKMFLFTLILILIGSATFVHFDEHYFSGLENSTIPKSTSLIPNYEFDNMNTPKRKIVLLGPHERFNFGDLLFEKVLSKLLETQLGYEDEEIIRGATIARDMSVHGGYHTISSMKQVQEMSRTSAAGPFDIIYTGGEALGCDFECGARMLPTPEFKQGAVGEKVYECAYLFPKDLLLPLDGEGNPDRSKKNIAIVNSMGGFPGIPACNAAVHSADYVAFRDSDPLVPDSAVMTKELYGDMISSIADEVRNVIFPEGTENRKYIAVQFVSNWDQRAGGYEGLAKALDEIARNTGCTIVFFAAGTAPTHDSFYTYRQVASFMTEPNFVYETERVWNVVATIAGSEAVLGTSLHVRIMGFIFHKPRVTWCTHSKHSNFINTWDAPNMRTCGDVSSSWTLLSKYMGPTPEISQEQTKEYYAEVVTRYMESFKIWADMLNASNKRTSSDHYCLEGEIQYMRSYPEIVEVVARDFEKAWYHYMNIGKYEGKSYFCDI